MAWCSICRNEYDDNIDTCPTCNTALVDQLDAHNEEDILLDEDALENEDSLDDEDGLDDKDALTDEGALDDEDIPTNNLYNFDSSTKPYIMKEDQYQELSSTVWIFLTFGIAGLIFVLLNIVGILNILDGILPNVVMGALFFFFLWVGISTHHKAKAVQLEIDEENKLTEKIKQWLSDNVTSEFLKDNHDSEESDEANYIRISEIVKQHLTELFGKQDPAYLDKLYEDYYNSHFD